MSAGIAILRIGQKNELIRCPSRSHIPGWGAAGTPMMDETIPTCYSTQHLLESGWVYTNSRRYNPHGGSGGAWVCPECASKTKWSWT